MDVVQRPDEYGFEAKQRRTIMCPRDSAIAVSNNPRCLTIPVAVTSPASRTSARRGDAFLKGLPGQLGNRLAL